ncbi:hypothetical protein [Bacillus cereus]|uniref:hypothetical protein n=1 Tax=Bacillus cereus TaxID=1396 RepID=UPI003D6481F6
MQKKLFTKYKQEIVTVFEQLLIRINSIYGYMSDEKIIDRQHITGTIENRIPAYNYFGELLVYFIGEEKLFRESK